MSHHDASTNPRDPRTRLHGGEPRISFLSPEALRTALDRRRSTHPEVPAEARRVKLLLDSNGAQSTQLSVAYSVDGRVDAHIRYVQDGHMYLLRLEHRP